MASSLLLRRLQRQKKRREALPQPQGPHRESCPWEVMGVSGEQSRWELRRLSQGGSIAARTPNHSLLSLLDAAEDLVTAVHPLLLLQTTDAAATHSNATRDPVTTWDHSMFPAPTVRDTGADVAPTHPGSTFALASSASMIADLMMAYQQVLERRVVSGDVAAAMGADLLRKVRMGLPEVIGQMKNASDPHEGHSNGQRLQAFLEELEKDISMIHHYHEQEPPPLAIAFTSAHCLEAARLLRRM